MMSVSRIKMFSMALCIIFLITIPVNAVSTEADHQASITKRRAKKTVISSSGYIRMESEIVDKPRTVILSEWTCEATSQRVWMIMTGTPFSSELGQTYIDRTYFAVDQHTGQLYRYSNAEAALIPIDNIGNQIDQVTSCM